MLWHIGNTTVRTPYRLRDALKILQGSPLNGNISGKEQENAFAKLLHDHGIASSPRLERGEDASDLGRKWRAALSQLGFITPQFTSGRKYKSGSIDPELSVFVDGIEALSGRAYEVTPNGYRLADADIITAQQECFLRALAGYQIPSIIEDRYKGISFSPLHFILNIMHGLSEIGEVARLAFAEFALFVQTSTPEDDIDKIVQNIVEYRTGKEAAKGSVRAYKRQIYEKIASNIGKEISTLDDYADLSFRYLKATGLFRNAGRGITVSSTRVQLAALLRNAQIINQGEHKAYLHNLWLGADLPTDNVSEAYAVIYDLQQQLADRNISVSIPDPTKSLQDLEQKRYELEAMILQLDEQEYAKEQANQIDEILAWFKAIPLRGKGSKISLPNGNTVAVPKGEGPAYLEWAIWRAFLAINSLSNQPWEARRFQIDQDFLPVHCAPGGGPDMVFEFDDVIIVVEVTLTASSRQEAAEGEPVRRHVAQYAEQSEKEVYGLFIALQIDSNTAHTFRSGDWYLANDSKMTLDIVPLTLGDFEKFLASGRECLSNMPQLLHTLMMQCRAKSNQDAPQWKQSITEIVHRISNQSRGTS